MNHAEEMLGIVIDAASSLNIDIMLIGAYSRDYWRNHFQIKAPARTTEDIDLACQIIAWDEYKQLFDILLKQYGFTRDRQKTHTLWLRNELAVDLIPFGGVVDENGNILWPPEFDTSLCVLGYDAAKNDAETIMVCSRELKIIKPYWLALLKLQAYIENPARQKDLVDFHFLADHYFDFIDEDERLYSPSAIDADVLNADDFDTRIAAAILIARDCLRSSPEVATRIMRKVIEFNKDHALTVALIAAVNNLHEDIAERILFAATHEWDANR